MIDLTSSNSNWLITTVFAPGILAARWLVLFGENRSNGTIKNQSETIARLTQDLAKHNERLEKLELDVLKYRELKITQDEKISRLKIYTIQLLEILKRNNITPPEPADSPFLDTSSSSFRHPLTPNF